MINNSEKDPVAARMENVKNHFESEALEYDGIIRKLIPDYLQMIQALVVALPFSPAQNYEVADLGCGTGTLAHAVKNTFPNASITCVDLSGKMLEMARLKLRGAMDRFVQSDFYDLEFDRSYDAIISSLALHHLETDPDKLIVYQKIFKALKRGGVFINADVILTSNSQLQEKYLEMWWDFMRTNVPAGEVETKWKLTYKNEDRPTTMENHIDMLKQAGFGDIEIIWKRYNFAVYMGVKK